MAKPRKGIVLAGGRGTRLFPLTVATNKHLLAVHDKPMVYYPLSTLMLGGIRDLLVVSNADDLGAFERLLGDGAHLGVSIRYAAQSEPRGIADGFLVGARFLDGEGCALALGDNIFWGHLDFLRAALAHDHGATIFAYPVEDVSRYGVVTLGPRGEIERIEEKPPPPSRAKLARVRQLAIPGLYVFDGDVVEIAQRLKPSSRGELEITDVQRAYLARGDLRVAPLGRGMAWLDMGTTASLLEASEFVAAIERRQGLRIGCLEECALHMGFCTAAELRSAVEKYPRGPYRDYVETLLEE